MEKNKRKLLNQMISKRIKYKKITGDKREYKKTKRVIKKRNIKKKSKKYSGGYIDPPPPIKADFSVENPKVNENSNGDPYQTTNQNLQDQNQQQANTNKSINGNGGTRKRKKKIYKKSLKKYIGNKIVINNKKRRCV